jgi:uncharacterized membrane protein
MAATLPLNVSVAIIKRKEFLGHAHATNTQTYAERRRSAMGRASHHVPTRAPARGLYDHSRRAEHGLWRSPFKAHSEAHLTMRAFSQFLLVTLVRGILFLVPIVLVAVLAREGYRMLRQVSELIARLLPQDRVFGILVEDLLSVVVIVLVFLIAGLFVGTGPGRLLSNRLEQIVLYRVPGYLMVRAAVGSFPGLREDARPQPALVETDEGWAFALVVERLPQGFCTVFLPDSPSPTSGAVRIIEDARVRTLETSMLSLLGCLTRSGTGAGALVGSVLGDPTSGARGAVDDERAGKV